MSKRRERSGFIERQRRNARVITLVGSAALSFALLPHHVGSPEKAGAEAVTVLQQGNNKPNHSSPEHAKPKYSLDQLLQAIAHHESGGNPRAFNPEGGGAHGKYQFQTLTWKDAAERFYPPALAYTNADEAPESVQDAVQYLRYLSIFTSVNEDAFAAATVNYMPSYKKIAFYNHNDPRLDYAPPTNHGLTIKQFDNQIMDRLDNKKAVDIPMLYMQAPEFEKWHAIAWQDSLTPAGRAELTAMGQR